MFYYSLGKKKRKKLCSSGKGCPQKKFQYAETFVSLGNQGSFSLLPFELGQTINC